MLKGILETVLGRVLTIGIFALLLVGGVAWLNHEHAKALKAANDIKDAAVLEAARAQAAQGTAIGQIIKERELAAKTSAALQKRVDALTKLGAKVTAGASTTVTIKDTAKAIPDEKFDSWTDEYHRFHLDVASKLFDRHQLFTLEQRFLRTPSGEYSVVTQEFREFDPVTHAEIPIMGVTIGTKYSVIEQKADGPGPWHLRAVAGVDVRASVGAGVQVNPWKWLTLGGLGLYNPKDKDFRAVVHVGYRVLGSTISVGPYLGITSKGGGLVGGAAATIEVTR